jgi:tetratricopeptide (TPR) repeat protein
MPENQPGRGGQNRRPSGGAGRRGPAPGGRGQASGGRGQASGGRGQAPAGRGQRQRPESSGTRGPGAFDNSERRGGSRLAPKKPRLPEPRIAEGVTGKELDRSIHQQLRTLSKENAEGVAQHLVMVAALLEADDLEGAEAHAETAVRRAGRVPAAREALGLVAYRKGEWARALSEFRTVRRLSGSSHLLPLMVDCERGLGRPERALELATSPEARTLAVEDRVELAIVVSGIRRDRGQLDAARLALEIPQLKATSRRPWSARLAYAYAEALLALGSTEDARDWFARAAHGDDDLQTDASERLAELDGVVLTDLLEGEDDEDEA